MLEVTLLGQFEVLQEGERRTIPSRSAQSLFAYLLLNAGQAHRREQLAGLLWPDSREDNARSYLRHELWRLRKILERTGRSYFLVDKLTIAFDAQSEYSLDVLTLERGTLEANTADGLAAALSVYRGELLLGFYEGWVTLERERLQDLFEARMARLLERLQAEERWTEVQDWASRWIAFGQWPESAYRALISAYASAGDISRVVSTYKRLEHGMVSELGIEPSEQSRALFESLQAGWKTGAMAPTAALTAQGPIASADQAPADPATPTLDQFHRP
jgi:DNA-binding SARP family transcriptional activator